MIPLENYEGIDIELVLQRKGVSSVSTVFYADGNVLQGSKSNVFFVDRDLEVFTPSLLLRCYLPCVMRDTVMVRSNQKMQKVTETDVSWEFLKEKIVAGFLVDDGLGVVPICSVKLGGERVIFEKSEKKLLDYGRPKDTLIVGDDNYSTEPWFSKL